MAEILERIYTIPLKRETNKVAYYKRAKKAVKAIKVFLAKHMKVENRDIKKIKLSDNINQAIWSRSIKNPPQKITVKAIKDKEGIVKTEFVGLPKKFKSEEAKIKKLMEKKERKAKEAKEKVKKKGTEKIAKDKLEENKEKVEQKEKPEEKKPEKKVKKV